MEPLQTETIKKRPSYRPLSFHGADNGIRTRDPHLGKVMLYQLSHVRMSKNQFKRKTNRRKIKLIVVN